MNLPATPQDNVQAIGVFDSGVGGLSVLRHIRTHLPNEDLLYFADSYYAPYGNKTPEFIIKRACYIADFLIAQGAKVLVVACNTATAAAVSHLRHHYAIPIVGMEPAVKPAAAVTKTGVVGVLATVGTLKSAQFAALLEHYGQHIKVVTQACHGLVECVENGQLQTEYTQKLLEQYLKPLLDAHADTIVLGCTHYPFLRPLIDKIVGDDIHIIDTGAAVARHLHYCLQQADLLVTGRRVGQVKFWSNSQLYGAEAVTSRLWGKKTELSAP